MSAVERWAIRDMKWSAILMVAVSIAALVGITVAWFIDPDALIGKIIGSLITAFLVLLFGGAGLSLIYAIGIIRGQRGWHDGYEIRQFEKRVADRRAKLEAQLK